MPQNPNCTRCELHKTTSRVCVWGQYPDNATISVVAIGEAPGASEERTGLPFQGQSGQVLRKTLEQNDLLDSTYITNAVKCRPPNNEKPTAAQVKACKPYLEEELANLKPKFVLTLGAVPAKALFRGKAKISEFHGELIKDPKHPWTGMPAFHPAYTLYDASKLPAFQNDIARLARAYRGESRKDDVNWGIVRRGNVQAFLRDFEAATEFAFDIESTQLFPHRPDEGHINCIALAFAEKTWVIPNMRGYKFKEKGKKGKILVHKSAWLTRGGAFGLLMRWLFRLARRLKKRGIAHNGKFDNSWLFRKTKGSFRLSFDTMLASHTLDENREHGLKPLARTLLDVPDYEPTADEKKGKVRRPADLYEYCARDATYEFRLAKRFSKELSKEPELHRLFYKLVMPAARAMEQIERVGMTIDLDLMEERGIELISQRVAMLNELNKVARINWNAPDQVARVLYKKLKLKATVFTPKGKPSTSEKALIDIQDQSPVVKQLVKYRELAKFISTYIVGLKEFMVDGQLHISFKLHGTVTGRYSSRIHSIPRDGTIRNLVTAPPGWRFVQADISQAELRVIATLSGDLEMRRCFLSGIDIHWRTLMFVLQSGGIGEYIPHLRDTATKLFGEKLGVAASAEQLLEIGHDAAIKVWEGWKEGRKKAKAVNFGYVYGMFEKKFIETAKTKYGWEPSWDEAHSNREAYFQLYTGLKPWHDKQKSLCKINGYVRTLSGRRRRLPGIYAKEFKHRGEAERQAINAPVQGFIGDYKAMCLVEIHETIDRSKFKLVGEHHDALLGIVREGCEAEVLPRILTIIRKPALLETFKIELDVPMDGEIEIGPWGQKGNQKWTQAA